MARRGGTGELIRSTDTDAWSKALSRFPWYDTYHLSSYHELAERDGEGDGYLFLYSHDHDQIALPLLVRSVAEVSGLDGTSFNDATSVYGYPGPISSSESPGAEVVSGFQAALDDTLREMRIVAIYSRLNPLVPQTQLLAGMGQRARSGTTISIDLSQSEEDQLRGYRDNHVRGLRKLRTAGARAIHDRELSNFDTFVAMYHETMERLGADERYFFSSRHFQFMRERMRDRLQLFTCVIGNEPVAAALFFVTHGIVQYHLGATRADQVRLGPMKLLIDAARSWGTATGQKVLHLGGGLGAREDSLFLFKRGFSDRQHDYWTWRHIVDPDAYARLVGARQEWQQAHGGSTNDAEYFPAYRAPMTRFPNLSAPGEH